MSAGESLILTPPNDALAVALGRPEFPHGDELTFFEVSISGPGVEARVAVESISGDCGFRLPMPAAGAVDALPLSGYLRELGQASRSWTGAIGWRSLADELRFHASCDPLGHVTLLAEARPRPWKPTWEASASFVWALGDLMTLADEVEMWFRH